MSAFTVLSSIAYDWASRCFGDQVKSLPMRSLRLAEEAVELAQAAKVPEETMHLLVSKVYGREPGEVHREIGGVLLTTAVLCELLKVPMETYLRTEVQRVLAKPEKHFKERNEYKNRQGLVV